VETVRREAALPDKRIQQPGSDSDSRGGGALAGPSARGASRGSAHIAGGSSDGDAAGQATGGSGPSRLAAASSRGGGRAAGDGPLEAASAELPDADTMEAELLEGLLQLAPGAWRGTTEGGAEPRGGGPAAVAAARPSKRPRLEGGAPLESRQGGASGSAPIDQREVWRRMGAAAMAAGPHHPSAAIGLPVPTQLHPGLPVAPQYPQYPSGPLPGLPAPGTAPGTTLASQRRAAAANSRACVETLAPSPAARRVDRCYIRFPCFFFGPTFPRCVRAVRVARSLRAV
jgi:hypothetical protein